MTFKECENCKKLINIKKEMHVTLGTHQGKEITDIKYFHWNCWRLYFEEKARQKAEVVIKGMQEKMMPIAKQMTEKLKNAIGSRGDKVYNLN